MKFENRIAIAPSRPVRAADGSLEGRAVERGVTPRASPTRVARVAIDVGEVR